MSTRKFNWLLFESRVELVPFSECWLWNGSRSDRGYAMFADNRAHRLMYERHNGHIPDGMHVLHTCHNGHMGCVTPHHLKIGTHKENMRDKVLCGNHRNKCFLSKEDQVDVWRCYVELRRQLADAYGVPIGTIERFFCVKKR